MSGDDRGREGRGKRGGVSGGAGWHSSFHCVTTLQGAYFRSCVSIHFPPLNIVMTRNQQ